MWEWMWCSLFFVGLSALQATLPQKFKQLWEGPVGQDCPWNAKMGKTAWECYEARLTWKIFSSVLTWCQLQAKTGKQGTVHCKVILGATGELQMQNGKVSQTQVTPPWVHPQEKLSVARTGNLLLLFNSKLFNSKLTWAVMACTPCGVWYDVLSIEVGEERI